MTCFEGGAQARSGSGELFSRMYSRPDNGIFANSLTTASLGSGAGLGLGGVSDRKPILEMGHLYIEACVCVTHSYVASMDTSNPGTPQSTSGRTGDYLTWVELYSMSHSS